MPHVAGGKVTKAHTTATDLAAEIVIWLDKREEVRVIRLSQITFKRGRKGGEKIIKIEDINKATIRLKITEANNTQDIIVVTMNSQITKLDLALYIVRKSYKLRFPEK